MIGLSPNDLEVNDFVILERQYHSKGLSYEQIARVNKFNQSVSEKIRRISKINGKWIELEGEETKYSLKDGNAIGLKEYYAVDRIVIPEDNNEIEIVREIITRRNLVGWLKNTNYVDLSTETVKAIKILIQEDIWGQGKKILHTFEGDY